MINEIKQTGILNYLKISMSCGTATYDPASPISLDQLISLADELMYTQKKTRISGRI